MTFTSYIKRRITIILRKLRANYYLWQVINAIQKASGKDIIHRRCLENLLIAKKVLNSLGMKYWLTDGTLLGFYRDGNFIQGDTDVDIGVFIDEWTPQLISTFKKNGLRLLRVNGSKDRGLEYTFTRKGVNLDVFFFYREDDYVWHATWLGNEMIRYRFPHFDVKDYEFMGHTFSAPANIEEYISLKYGENWRTPIRNWNWARDPANIF